MGATLSSLRERLITQAQSIEAQLEFRGGSNTVDAWINPDDGSLCFAHKSISEKDLPDFITWLTILTS